MSRYTTRRIAAAVGTACTSAVLAAMLTTGTAAAQDDQDPSVTCAQAQAALRTAQAAAADPDGPGGTVQDGRVITPAEQATINAAVAAATAAATAPASPPGAPNGGEITAAEQAAIDAVRANATTVATNPNSPGTRTDGTVVTATEQARITAAQAVVNRECPDPVTPTTTPTPPPFIDKDCDDFPDRAAAQAFYNADRTDPHKLDADKDGIACEVTEGGTFPAAVPAASVVVCVLKPGTCAEVKVDAQGRLVEIFREIKCDTGQLPVATGTRKGERVTVVNRQVVERHVTSDPGSTTTYLPSDPGTSSTYSGGQVTQIPTGAVATGDGSYRTS